MDFCYQKHGYHNINKQQSRVNVVSQENFDASNSSSYSLLNSTSSNTGLSQDQYAQLVSLLQQANLVAPASTLSIATSNHIIVIPLVSFSILASEANFVGISFSLPSSLQQKSTHWLIDSGANEHICCNISFFSSLYKIKPVQVTLPNGHSILVHYAGTVSFSPQHHQKLTSSETEDHRELKIIKS